MISATKASIHRRRKSDAVTLRDNVLAIVAHDLRTPLNTIAMATEILRDLDHNDDKHLHFLEMISKAAAQADVLIRDLVDVARIEAGSLRIERTREPLAYLLQSVTETFMHNAEHADILLACDTQQIKGVIISIDAARFIQLLSNLISNALKFTSSGGSIRVAGEVVGKNVRITVQDSGIGISRQELPHVFERFWQAAHHRRAGAGLGLAIAKGIVEAHQGEIGVESEEDRGSTFFFTLPLVPA